MNKPRRKAINDVSLHLNKATEMLNVISADRIARCIVYVQEYYEKLDDILGEEQDVFDSIPENLQSSQRGIDSEDAIDNMEDAQESLDDALEDMEIVLSEIRQGKNIDKDKVNSIQNMIDDAIMSLGMII